MSIYAKNDSDNLVEYTAFEGDDFALYEENVIRENFRLSGLDRVVITDDEDLYDYDREDEEDDEEDYNF